MARPEPALLDAARYPFVVEITTRYADMDPNHHLNNVAMAALIEDARVRFNTANDFRAAMGGMGAMIASVAIDYLAQGYYPHPISGYAAVESVGRSSWTLVQLMVQQGQPVAFARSVAVGIAHARPAPLPDAFRTNLARVTLRG
jgi:acyl-CoA thioester hydrolase